MAATTVHVHCLDGETASGTITTRCGDYEQPATAQIVDLVGSGKPLTLWHEGDLVVIPVSSIARLVIPSRQRVPSPASPRTEQED